MWQAPHVGLRFIFTGPCSGWIKSSPKWALLTTPFPLCPRQSWPLGNCRCLGSHAEADWLKGGGRGLYSTWRQFVWGPKFWLKHPQFSARENLEDTWQLCVTKHVNWWGHHTCGKYPPLVLFVREVGFLRQFVFLSISFAFSFLFLAVYKSVFHWRKKKKNLHCSLKTSTVLYRVV